MKMSYSNGRTVSTPGHLRALLQYLETVVELLEALPMGAYARKILLSITVMEMMKGHMVLAVGHQTKM